MNGIWPIQTSETFFNVHITFSSMLKIAENKNLLHENAKQMGIESQQQQSGERKRLCVEKRSLSNILSCYSLFVFFLNVVLSHFSLLIELSCNANVQTVINVYNKHYLHPINSIRLWF